MTHGEKCSVVNVQGNLLDELVCREVLRYNEEESNINQILKKAVASMEVTSEKKVTSADLLEQEIQKRKKEVQNLISVLARSGGNEEFVSQIEKEIIKLNDECAVLEGERSEMGQEEWDIQGDRQQLEFLLEQLATFQRTFDTMNVVQKREYLRMILDKVVWDGEQAHIFIYGSH